MSKRKDKPYEIGTRLRVNSGNAMEWGTGKVTDTRESETGIWYRLEQDGGWPCGWFNWRIVSPVETINE
jgi:hypothetical protein